MGFRFSRVKNSSYNEIPLQQKGTVMDVKRFLDNLGRQVEENPLLALGIATAAAAAATKLMQASAEQRNSRSWAKEVDRRRMKSLTQ